MTVRCSRMLRRPQARDMNRFTADGLWMSDGFDEHGFMRNMWERLPQDGLWLKGGSLIECRTHSRYLALEIKAQIEGLLPAIPLV